MPVKPRRQQGSEEQIGDVKFSMLNEAQFQSLHGPTWVRAQGQSIAGSDLAVEFGITSLDDPRSRTIVATGQGAGLTDRSNRSTFGTETHQLTGPESGTKAHRHFVMAPASVIGSTPLTNTNQLAHVRDVGLGEPSAYYTYGADGGGTGVEASVGRSSDIGDQTAAQAHPNVQPSIAYYCYVKINR